jgi:predicted DNA-binding WGR domain protein
MFKKSTKQFKKIVVKTKADYELEKRTAATPVTPAPAVNIPAAQPYITPVTKPSVPTCNIAKLTYYNHGTRPGTYKQWSIWVKDNVVTTEWGPYLGTLQSTSKAYKFDWQASECYNKILYAKIKKGYVKAITDLNEF